MADSTEILVEIGGAARRFGVSTSTIRNWELAGILPLGMRLESSGRRVWREADLNDVQPKMKARRIERQFVGSGEAA